MATGKNAPQQVQADEFDVPEEFNEQMQGAMAEGVQLSVYAPYLSWFNGAAAYKTSGALAPYTGGWSMFEQDAIVLSKEYGRMHGSFGRVEGVQGKEGEYVAWMAQWLAVAVIGTRQRWIETDGKKRSHTQIFVYLAEVADDAFVPFAPACLTVKGMQSDYLTKSLNEWRTKSAKARREVAKGLSETAFWVPLGVFSKKRETVQVGTPPNAQQISPIGVMLPPDYSKETLLNLYIGKEIAKEIMDLRADNREWLDEWKKQEADRRAQGPQSSGGSGQSQVPEPPPFDYVEE